MNRVLRVMAIAGLWLVLGAFAGCGRAGIALGDAVRSQSWPRQQLGGTYPDEIACIYEGWPLYFRQRYVAASGGYVCVYAGHGHTGTIACD